VLPFLAGATGKVFLAQLEEKKANEIIQRKAWLDLL
jgi:DNA-binding IclR family transcriptional regulator